MLLTLNETYVNLNQKEVTNECRAITILSSDI